MAYSVMALTRELYRATVDDPQKFRAILQDAGRSATRYDIAPALWPKSAAPAILYDMALYLKNNKS